MVWGMYLPKSGGIYGPYGSEEGLIDRQHNGWWLRRIRYFEEQLPEAEQRNYRNALDYAGSIGDKFTCERGRREPSHPTRIVTAIESHEPPAFFEPSKYMDHFDEFGSILSLNNRMWAVDEAVKSLIERYEPDAHQFFPLEIRAMSGRVYPVRFYTFVVGTWLESFSEADSDPSSFTKQVLSGTTFFRTGDAKKQITGLALRGSVFKGSHVWRERGFNEWLLCFSDELAADFVSAGLKMPKYFRMRGV